MKIHKIYVLFISFFFSINLAMAQKAEHVILISIDGFRPDFYRYEKWPTINMKMLANEGVSADEVRTIFPSVTYPSHTTLISGVLPEDHGIYYNTEISADGKPGNWIYDFKEIQSKTIWEAAKEKNLVTASVSWPISVNNPYIDYNIPEIWSFSDPMDRRGATAKYANPKGLFEELEKEATGKLQKGEYNLSSRQMDQNLGRMASHIIEKYKPNLLTIHLPITDGAQHRSGREGLLVKRAVAGADLIIGEIYDALGRAEIMENTAIIVTGDHGFVSTHTSIAPNVWLKEHNLAEKAFFFSVGGAAFLHVNDEDKEVVLTKVKDMLEGLSLSQRSLFRIISKEQLQTMQSDPKVDLAITAIPGFSFNNAHQGKLLKEGKGGKHGYYPGFFDIYTGFIGYGKGFKKGETIQRMNLEDIAVIISELLGLNLPKSKGVAYPGLFRD